jgi:GTP-binding protein
VAVLVGLRQLRCRILIHVISGESPDPIGDFHAVNQELYMWDERLRDISQVVVVNKIDVPHVADGLGDLVTRLRACCGHSRVMGISAVRGDNVKELMRRVRNLFVALPEPKPLDHGSEPVDLRKEVVDPVHVAMIQKSPPVFRVTGGKVEKVLTIMWD